jgi:hypothetical protein
VAQESAYPLDGQRRIVHRPGAGAAQSEGGTMTAITTTDASAIVGAHAFDAHRRIVELRTVLEMTFLQLGQALYYFERERLYLDLDHPSFNSYLADPEVDLTRRTAYRLKGVYEHYIIKLGWTGDTVALVEAGIAKLDILRPLTTKENVEEKVYEAAALSRSDLLALRDGTEPLDDLDPDTEICWHCNGTGRVPKGGTNV